MPVLTIGGEKSLGEAMGQQAKLVATDVTVVVLKDTGHWVLEERPKDTTEGCKRFFDAHGSGSKQKSCSMFIRTIVN